MRTERRQDLRTNELSQHLDAVRDYAKQNAALLTIIVVAAAILVGAGFAYAKWQNDRRMEAWDQVEGADATANATKAIDDLEAVAAKNLTPGLTAAPC
jgi:predicted negative regulator of RcsB-dependent stress response